MKGKNIISQSCFIKWVVVCCTLTALTSNVCVQQNIKGKVTATTVYNDIVEERKVSGGYSYVRKDCELILENKRMVKYEPKNYSAYWKHVRIQKEDGKRAFVECVTPMLIQLNLTFFFKKTHAYIDIYYDGKGKVQKLQLHSNKRLIGNLPLDVIRKILSCMSTFRFTIIDGNEKTYSSIFVKLYNDKRYIQDRYIY